MEPEAMVSLVCGQCPGYFHPEYLMETEIGATSLLMRGWQCTAGSWKEIPVEFSNDDAALLLNSPKIKYYIQDGQLHAFVNDQANGYHDSFVIAL
jgi:hypothetical protein